MTEPNQTADNADARQASTTRVVTHESLLASLTTANPAPQDAPNEVPEDKPEGDEKPKAKKGVQERITELAHKRREAEAEAEAAKQYAKELEARLSALENARNTPIEASDKPQRSQFVNEDDYLEALTDWKAEQAVANRERQQREAQLKAEAEAIDNAFITRVKKAAEEIEDFEEVVGSANVNIPDFLVMAIKESESGPLLTYYLAKHQDEARRIAAMRPIQAIKALDRIERELVSDEPASEPEVSKPKPKRAPEPITPVKGTTTPNPGPAKSFKEYQERRKAEQRK